MLLKTPVDVGHTLVLVTAGSQASPTDSPADAEESAEQPPAPAGKPRRPLTVWRVGTPVVVLACGVLMAVSAVNSDGTDLRPGRYEDLAQLVSGDSARYQKLEHKVAQTQREVDRLTGEVSDKTVKESGTEAKGLAGAAGTTKISGQGISIVLSDAPREAQESYQGDPNDTVVHQQDIQAVVNALWAGGAQGITVAGRRIITTTGIKCAGGTVQLDGVPYPQPFVIQAVGDTNGMKTALDHDQHVIAYREQARDPNIRIGWSMSKPGYLQLPAYDGLLDVHYAKPLQDKSAK